VAKLSGAGTARPRAGRLWRARKRPCLPNTSPEAIFFGREAHPRDRFSPRAGAPLQRRVRFRIREVCGDGHPCGGPEFSSTTGQAGWPVRAQTSLLPRLDRRDGRATLRASRAGKVLLKRRYFLAPNGATRERPTARLHLAFRAGAGLETPTSQDVAARELVPQIEHPCRATNSADVSNIGTRRATSSSQQAAVNAAGFSSRRLLQRVCEFLREPICRGAERVAERLPLCKLSFPSRRLLRCSRRPSRHAACSLDLIHGNHCVSAHLRESRGNAW
jgi:hypothetical protein